MSNLSFWLFTQPSLWQHLSVSHDLKNDGLLPAPSPALQSHEGFGLYGKRMEQIFPFPSKIPVVEDPPQGSAQGPGVVTCGAHPLPGMPLSQVLWWWLLSWSRELRVALACPTSRQTPLALVPA